MESFLKMDCHIILACLFLRFLLDCSSTVVNCDAQNIQRQLPPSFRRDLSNKTVDSNGTDISAGSSDGIAKDIIGNVTDTISNSENVDNTSKTKIITSKPQLLDDGVTKPTENIKYTKSMLMETTDYVGSLNLNNATGSSKSTLKGNVTKVATDDVDIKPIDTLPNEERVSDITVKDHLESYIDSTTETVYTDYTKDKQTTLTKTVEKSPVLKETIAATKNHPVTFPSDFAETSDPSPSIEGGFNNNPLVAKITAMSTTFDTLTNVDDTIPDKTVDTGISTTAGNKQQTTFGETSKASETTSPSMTTTSNSEASTPKTGITTTAENDKTTSLNPLVGKRKALSNSLDKFTNVDDKLAESTVEMLLGLQLQNVTSEFGLTLIATNPALHENTTSTDASTIAETTIPDKTVDTGISTTTGNKQQTTFGETSKATETTSPSMTTTSKKKASTPKTGVTITTENDRTTSLKSLTPTTDKDQRNSGKSEGSDKQDSKESMFGKYGLAMFIAACIVALCLLLVVIYLLLKKKRKRNKDDFMVGDSVPKLKMLEVRNSSLPGELKAGKSSKKDDDLPTYSLDYEKHVQEKIEEHRQLVKSKSQNPALPGAEPTPLAGVTSFKIARRPSAESWGKRSSQKSRSGSQSGPTSPVTPTSPEGKPLLDKEDEPVVFNFAKKPGEATAAREARAARRGSAPSAGNKMKSVTKSKDDYFGINV